MSLTRPTFDVDNIQGLLDIVQNQKAALKILFDKTGADTKTYLISLLDEIEIDFATKEEVADIILGQITDGSLTDVKLSDAADQIKTRLANHLIVYAAFVATKGQSNGLATLDSGGLVPLAQTPTRFANGAFTETTFSGDVGATFIKTIPLGFVGKKGTVHLSATPTTSGVNSLNVTTYTGTTEVWVNGESRNVTITTSFCWYLKRAYLSGTDLIIEVWRQSNAGSIYTIDLNVRWEVFA